MIWAGALRLPNFERGNVMESTLKIGVCEKEYARWGDERFHKLKEHGFSHIDYDMSNTESKMYNCDEKQFEAMLLKEKSLIETAGISVSQVHGPWRWPPRDSTVEERSERMEKMKMSIRGTAILGCKHWVIHPIMPHGIQEKGTDLARETWQLNLEFMRELLETAKTHDVIICFENMPMPNFSLGSPSEILEFVKEMNDDNFKICLDTGHVSVYKDLNPADAARDLKDEIRVIHVHDNNGRSDYHYLPYFGVIDWKAFGQALKEIGFDGVFSLETAPSQKLPTPIFEEMCKLLVKMAKEIMEG